MSRFIIVSAPERLLGGFAGPYNRLRSRPRLDVTGVADAIGMICEAVQMLRLARDSN
jgi:hypothetical protein